MGSSLKAACVTREEVNTAGEPDVAGAAMKTTREIKAV
jgi:hypothetical protein